MKKVKPFPSNSADIRPFIPDRNRADEELCRKPLSKDQLLEFASVLYGGQEKSVKKVR